MLIRFGILPFVPVAIPFSTYRISRCYEEWRDGTEWFSSATRFLSWLENHRALIGRLLGGKHKIPVFYSIAELDLYLEIIEYNSISRNVV